MELDKWQKYVAVASVGSILISGLYLLGYWRQFGVNIFEHIDLSDVVKLSIYPLSGLLVFGFLTSSLNSAGLFLLDFFRKSNKGKEIKENLFLVSALVTSSITALLLVLGVLYFVLTIVTYGKWIIIAFVFSSIASLPLSKHKYIMKLTSLRFISLPIVFLLTFVVTGAYGLGEMRASQARESDNFVIINGAQTQNIYVGRAGGFIFLWSRKTGNVLQVKESEIQSIEFSAPINTPIINFEDKQ